MISIYDNNKKLSYDFHIWQEQKVILRFPYKTITKSYPMISTYDKNKKLSYDFHIWQEQKVILWFPHKTITKIYPMIDFHIWQ